jgi:hypothetical protein
MKIPVSITWSKGDRYFLNKLFIYDTPDTMKVKYLE